MPLLPTRFSTLFAEGPPPLDLSCLEISRQVGPGSEPGEGLQGLDDLAAGLPEPTLDGLTRHLFEELGFAGNNEAYYDPANSFLDQVIERRRGIPITLSVLTIEVGRRAGVPLVGVGMPGHFLVRDQVDQGLYLDPFHAGARLRVADCERLYRSLQGPGARFDEDMLAPVPAETIVVRVLANLRTIYARAGDPDGLAGVLRLLLCTPAASGPLASECAVALQAVGRYDLAADAADLAARLEPAEADDHRARARMLRARLN